MKVTIITRDSLGAMDEVRDALHAAKVPAGALQELRDATIWAS